MTINELTDLMRRESDELDPASADRILAGALHGGARRRRGRHLAVGGSVAAVVTVVASGVALSLPGGSDPDPAPGGPDVVAAPSSPETTYAPGSKTEVPGGPVIETDRRIVGDAALATVTRDLLPADGVVTGLEVAHVWTSNPSHMADETRDGRRVSFVLDGAGASVTVQRWDGYAAVGVEDPQGDFSADLAQKVATTAREACGGSYQVFPARECQESAEGWYHVGRPSQGASAPAANEELLVELYTHDGYVILVDSYNTPGEKSGGVVAEDPVLTVPESLALARSPRWFVAE